MTQSESPAKLRILHITPYFTPAFAYGGTIRAAYDLCKHLADRGHAITVFTTDALDAKQRAPKGEHIIEGMHVRRFTNISNTLAWNRLFVPLGFRRGLAQAMHQYDIVHLHEFRTIQNAMVLGGLRRFNLPYIITSQGGLPAELGRTSYKHVYDALFGTKLMQGASRLHALTKMEHDQYRALGASPERIVILPNGIDVTAFDFEVDVEAYKRKWDIPLGRPVVGFLARLNRIKAPEFLIDAFAGLLQQVPDAILMFAGPDDGVQAELEAQIQRLGLGDAVRFVGYLSDAEAKAAAYRASDVYVLPSRYEIQGITVLEALLNEVPTITTDRCGLAHYLTTGNIAEVVPFGNVAALTERLYMMLTHASESKAQAERGRKAVCADFDWQTLTDRWEQTYRACFAEHKRH